MKSINMEEAFQTMPALPDGFEEYCYNMLPSIAIYYKRKGKIADCLCGKCGRLFVTHEVPVRNENARCPLCGNTGHWEWQKVTKQEWAQRDVCLIQCTEDKNLVIRFWRVYQSFKQGYMADIELYELKRWFLHMGDVYKFCNERRYSEGGWVRMWSEGGGNETVQIDRIYYTWRRELEKSDLKYCDVDAIRGCRVEYDMDTIAILETYANNPALEMFEKSGMKALVRHLVSKRGKTKRVNRRGKSMSAQLRLKDKQMIRRLIKEKGDVRYLEVLQEEQKRGYQWTEQQEKFLVEMSGQYRIKERLPHCLKYMTLQQLINRIAKYREQMKGRFTTDYGVLTKYDDYLLMREELGYDMTNEVYIYPKDLQEKHDQMVDEKNAKKDELHLQKMQEKFPEIAKQYQKLLRRYGYEDADYVIRPAKSAEEIVMEGRTLHHCVGREWYLKSHAEGQSYILFLRRKEEPDKPYYTVEIAGDEIKQWYGYNDKKPEQEIIGPWLDAYVERLKNRSMRKAG